MSSERVYAVLYIHGTSYYVRFDDDRSRDRFAAEVNASETRPQLVYGQDGIKTFIRPSSVDVFVPREKPGRI